MQNNDSIQLVELAADIVSAYVGNNSVAASELPQLLKDIHLALVGLSSPESARAEAPQKPAVPAVNSIFDDYLVCLEDGKKFKSLRRHLRSRYDLSPEEYREKWGLAPDYPMVAPNYAKARSRLAKEMGLGQQRNSSSGGAP
ncbi:MAG: MucR family transcriptional regulator [Beijerinckiaceae bacterium]|jgi:predicted transcriptional regulator|nr:MucR family transcriptional regulator [Beijerinckiaceae bacterium]